jgi:hypothetical protein
VGTIAAEVLGVTMKREVWNRCDYCGKFIALADFDADSGAIRKLVGDPSQEDFLTLCQKHAREWREARKR